MKKINVLLLWLALAQISVAGPLYFEDIKEPEFEVIYCVPDRLDGIYSLHESAKIKMKVNSLLADGKIQIAVSERDYYAKKIGDVLQKEFPLPNGESILELKLPAKKKYGYYSVTLGLKYNGKYLGYTQSAYMVLPPKPKKIDSYFMPDKNGMVQALSESMDRMGFGGRFIYMPSAATAVNSSSETLEKLYAVQAKRCMTYQKYGTFIASASPDIKNTKRAGKRLADSFAPVSDEDLLKIRKHYERLAEETKDSLKTWVIQEEFDAIYAIPKCKDDLIHYVSSYALIAKNIFLGLKKGNPDCQVGVLGICCDDYFNSPTPFLYSRLVLKALHKHYDFVALDAYTGNWNRRNGRFALPEKGLRRLLKDAAKLSEECGGQKKVANIERCFAICHGSAFDSDFGREQADVTARSMIINKGVPEAFCYSLHLPTFEYASRQALKTKKKTHTDMGIWKAVFTGKGASKPSFVPRSMAVAAATTARELAFCSNPKELVFPGGIYAYIFDAPDEKTLVAFWGVDGEKEVELDFPENYTITDISGNSVNSSGKCKQLLTTSPVFFRCSGNREEIENAVTGIKFNHAAILKPRIFVLNDKTIGVAVSNPGPMKGSCTVSFNGRSGEIDLPAHGIGYLKFKSGTPDRIKLTFQKQTVAHKVRISQIPVPAENGQEKSKPIQLRVPDHVDPPSALMPEYGIVKAGSNAPFADIYFSWNQRGLRVTATVGNKEHIQRKKDGKMSEDDSLVVEFCNFDFMMKNPRRQIPCIIFAKTSVGAQAYYKDIFGRGKYVDSCNVSVKGKTTTYNALIPWTLMPEFKPMKGKSFLFHVFCPMVARPMDKKALYALALEKAEGHFVTYCKSAVLE